MEDINKVFKKRLFFSIAVASLMCPILGIVAIIFNFQSKIAYENKDMDDYKISSKITNILLVCGFIVGILTWICIIGSVSIYTANKQQSITSENNLSITTKDCIKINNKTVSIPMDCKTFINTIPYKLGTDEKTTYIDKKETQEIELWDKDTNVVGSITVFNSKEKVENVLDTQVIGININDVDNVNFQYLSINNKSSLENIKQCLGNEYLETNNREKIDTSWNIDNYFINFQWKDDKISSFQITFTINS